MIVQLRAEQKEEKGVHQTGVTPAVTVAEEVEEAIGTFAQPYYPVRMNVQPIRPNTLVA